MYVVFNSVVLLRTTGTCFGTGHAMICYRVEGGYTRVEAVRALSDSIAELAI